MPVAGGRVGSGLLSPVSTPSLLNGIFIENGMAFALWPARACQCWSEMLGQPAQTGSPDPKCATCGGRGFVYNERITANGAMFTRMQHQTVWSEAGLTFTGGILMTVPYLPNLQTVYNELGFRDIVIPTGLLLESPVQVRRGVDKLPYAPTEVMEVSWNGAPFNPGTDYRITGQTILWVGNSPPADETYLVRMSYNPIYIVMDALATLRQYQDRRYPRQYLLEENPSLGDLLLQGAYGVENSDVEGAG